jgi:hypothetical protein
MVVTGDSSKKGVFYADSRDGGAFAPRVRLDADTGGAHPAVAVAGTGDVLAAWDIVSASGRAVVARRRTGNVWQPPIVLSDAASSPSAAATNTTFVVAWEQQAGENRTIRVGHVPGSR